MKQSKTQGNLSIGQDKDSGNIWKNKAIFRGEENCALRKRIKELISSRDSWKSKYQELQKEEDKTAILGSEKAARHQYSLVVISLLLALQNYGSMSLRSCRHCIGCLAVSLGLSIRIPSHSSIRNWLIKSGYHRIMEGEKKGGDYIVYVDESIVFGSEKMLLILGVSSANFGTDRALIHSDMEVLYAGASKEWKGDDIAVELAKIATVKTIQYVVSDEGTNLRKAYTSLNYTHIEDCTHILANYLKRIYKDDAVFEEFRKLIGKLRKNWNLSKEKSQYMPPTMRGKMRFANIFPCVQWAKKCLDNWVNLKEDVQNSLVFLKENTAFIDTLLLLETAFKSTCATLKNEGFGSRQKADIVAKLATLSGSENVAIFTKNCIQYLENLTQKREALGLQNICCSSDIIESFFGKFKTKINPNNRTGLTEFIFTIANFAQPFSIKEIKNALQNIKLKDIILDKKQPKTG